VTAKIRWRVITEHQRSNWTCTRWAAAISVRDRIAESRCSTSTTRSRTTGTALKKPWRTMLKSYEMKSFDYNRADRALSLTDDGFPIADVPKRNDQSHLIG
jgi:hypothetical protein